MQRSREQTAVHLGIRPLGIEPSPLSANTFAQDSNFRVTHSRSLEAIALGWRLQRLLSDLLTIGDTGHLIWKSSVACPNFLAFMSSMVKRI